ncbi:MAG TPA: TIGR03084 family metal-binding protein [Acidimicrobiales bacterium]|nr:TIGR03084 family metal-binding protein [Acidimicrobiales bacterium]
MHISELADELRAEQEALDAVVAALDGPAWLTPTPSPGWSVRDQIGHLTYFDGTAALAITDPAAFERSKAALLGSGDPDGLTLHRDEPPAGLLVAWRANRRALAQAAAGLEGSERLPWYGPSMGARSFLTARLMETWAHGQDVVDAVGGDRTPTDRLRHIAQLGFITRGWTYANRGEQPPSGDVRLELVAPSGELWRYGPDGAADVVRGPAEDFCLVVTQRRHVDDTTLEVTGPAARDWMTKAQAFAGAATDGPRPRSA